MQNIVKLNTFQNGSEKESRGQECDHELKRQQRYDIDRYICHGLLGAFSARRWGPPKGIMYRDYYWPTGYKHTTVRPHGGRWKSKLME